MPDFLIPLIACATVAAFSLWIGYGFGVTKGEARARTAAARDTLDKAEHRLLEMAGELANVTQQRQKDFDTAECRRRLSAPAAASRPTWLSACSRPTLPARRTGRNSRPPSSSPSVPAWSASWTRQTRTTSSRRPPPPRCWRPAGRSESRCPPSPRRLPRSRRPSRATVPSAVDGARSSWRTSSRWPGSPREWTGTGRRAERPGPIWSSTCPGTRGSRWTRRRRWMPSSRS